MNALSARPSTHHDLVQWARAVRTEVDDLLRAMVDRPTVDHEAAEAAHCHLQAGFQLVDQALGITSCS